MLLIGRVLYAGGGAFSASWAACAAACAALVLLLSEADELLLRVVGV